MAYEIVFKAGIKKDLKKLDRSAASRLLSAIFDKLGAFPESGELLTGRFAGLRRLRVGEYRVIYEVAETAVFVLRIAHRKDVYE